MDIAFLLDRLDQPGWVRGLIETVRQLPGVTRTSIILATPNASTLPATGSRISDTVLAGVQRLEAKQLNSDEHAQFHREDVSEEIRGIPIQWMALAAYEGGIHPDLIERDAYIYPTSASGNPDLIIALAMNPDRAVVALNPRHGCWVLSHSSEALGADRHAGLTEVADRSDHTRFSLIRLGRRAHEDRILVQREFNTEYFWLKNKARSVKLGSLVVIDAILALDTVTEDSKWPLIKDTDRISGDHPIYAKPVRRRPKMYAIGRYLTKQAGLSFSMMYRKLAKRDVYWRIGMSRSGTAPFGQAEFDVLTAPKGRFFADPFIYTHPGEPYLFFEDYAFSDGRGKISAAKYVNGKFEFLGVVLDLSYHLSFPYVFNHEGEIYMMPETCGNHTIELWRCVEFPLKWERHVTLMDNVSAVDSILFHHEQRWWLLTNIDRTGGVSHNDELFAFYADSPISSNWTPHARNPIISDPRRARNGGMFISENGDITRAAQYQGFCHYGKGVSLNKIKRLTPNTYIEEVGPVHYADFVSGSRPSTHHCHQNGGHTVFDFSFIE